MLKHREQVNFQPSHLFSFMLIPKSPDASLSHGKSYLSHISSTHNTKYNTLSKEEQTILLDEFGEYKLTKETRFCLSNKVKINDCTHTFKAIETEVCVSCPFKLLDFDFFVTKS